MQATHFSVARIAQYSISYFNHFKWKKVMHDATIRTICSANANNSRINKEENVHPNNSHLRVLYSSQIWRKFRCLLQKQHNFIVAYEMSGVHSFPTIFAIKTFSPSPIFACNFTRMHMLNLTKFWIIAKKFVMDQRMDGIGDVRRNCVHLARKVLTIVEQFYFSHRKCIYGSIGKK